MSRADDLAPMAGAATYESLEPKGAHVVNLLQRHAHALRWVCLFLSANLTLFFVGLALFGQRNTALLAAVCAVAGALNTTTLYVLGGGDAEERSLRAKLRKLSLQVRIKEGEYLLDPRGSMTPAKDAERYRRFVEQSSA